MAKKSKARPGTKPDAITINQATNIPLSKLVFSPDNVRQTEPDREVAAMADSIARRSMLQSLSVRPEMDADGNATGNYTVPGGGRRLRALLLLAKQKRLSSEVLIPCIVKSDGSAIEDSLAENSDREALHPVDEFRAFLALRQEGKGDEEIAAAFGVTPTVVRQRMRLANASPVLLEAYVVEEIDLDALMAFCVSDDKAKQEKVWAVMKGNGYMPEYRIKQLMTEDTVRGDDRRAIFVGADAYHAAGGTIVHDLFTENGEGAYFQDAALLTKLAQDKLEALRQPLLDAGWKWAEAALEIPSGSKMGLDRLNPVNEEDDERDTEVAKLEEELEKLQELDEHSAKQQKRIEKIEARLAEVDNMPPVYSAEDMARAGVFVSLDQWGQPSCDYGFLRDEDVVTEGDEEHHDGADGSADPADVEADEPAEAGLKPISERLVQDLTSFRTVALRNAMADNYDVAFLAALHAMCLGQFYHLASNSCLQLTVRTEFPAMAEGLDEWTGTRLLEQRKAAWKAQLPGNPADLWEALEAMPQVERQALFAHCVSQGVNAVKEPHVKRTDAIRTADQLAATLDLNMLAVGFVPDVRTYFGRVTKPQIVEAVREAKGDDAAELIGHLKKDKMAEEAARLVQGTGWMPAALRTSSEVPSAGEPAADDDLPEFLSDESVSEAAAA